MLGRGQMAEGCGWTVRISKSQWLLSDSFRVASQCPSSHWWQMSKELLFDTQPPTLPPFTRASPRRPWPLSRSFPHLFFVGRCGTRWLELSKTLQCYSWHCALLERLMCTGRAVAVQMDRKQVRDGTVIMWLSLSSFSCTLCCSSQVRFMTFWGRSRVNGDILGRCLGKKELSFSKFCLEFRVSNHLDLFPERNQCFISSPQFPFCFQSTLHWAFTAFSSFVLSYPFHLFSMIHVHRIKHWWWFFSGRASRVHIH